MLLTAELLLHYQRCNRRAFLDVCGDRTKRELPSDFHLKLLQDRFAHQKTFLAEEVYHQPIYAKGDWQAGAIATLALMEQGVDRIHKGVLLTEMAIAQREEFFNSKLSQGEEFAEKDIASDQQIIAANASPLLPSGPVVLLSRPDLLVKQPGQSRFGDWLYVPVDIQLGKRAKLDYQIIAAFHAQVLAQVQQAMPATAWLILREKGAYPVNLDIRMSQMQIILEECSQVLLKEQEPEVFISRQRCSICGWYNYCYEIAKSQQHLSLLPGVTPSRYTYLQALNLTTLSSLANVSLSVLEEVFDREVAVQLVRQAQSVLENRAILISPQPLNLPTATVELYFDIEAEPDLDIAYLLGVLVVDREAKTEKFYPFLAEQPEDEASTWQQFLDLVWTYPLAPIFHFCDYEVLAVRRLAGRYNTPNHLWKPLLTRFVDIHEGICSGVTLPVENYTLKAIARWLGFEWRDAKANGAQAIYWYDLWLKTCDRTLLDKIVLYNEDDCRATHHVKDWLANAVQNSVQINAG
ncbi:TM0106 family RecB-like putative nuclease [Argonema antarcticum]|uniref:TM0106 family RecB-like putative nuclease n=1 Tax=Argonema antarcticum TaxID=2942763 RepID=UPI0020135735|nr:TM0106 family RecB-like putative nuclease [Argonema antarcticum]MCL1471688.1 TM0106 family RecB-like putative nuclease [Argonema antarcticum A004/B2]